uniref:Protein sip5 n=1 Tax=Bionectria ochroleuca TaxID=29856 RepID=A0A8H7TNS8_BIOOC
MGNTNGKESDPEGPYATRRSVADSSAQTAADRDRERSSRNHRASRTELSFLGISSSSGTRDRNRNREDAPFTHRETRQEREARKLERERAARLKERERSMKEEHVDGGFLVTLGTYTGTEDYSKTVVRQLLIERKLAPFWRGLNDWSESWTEHQLIAAARGLPIPAADEVPDPELVARPPRTDQNIQNLTVPMGPRTLSAASDHSASAAGPNVATTTGKSSAFKAPRAKALAAALGVSSRNTSATELAPREIFLPNDPFVNGQALEVFLYKDATECPICFLTYPPYLNQTRCCDQPICSECFVQIKRADPHLPEHHPDGQARDPNEGLNPEDPPEMLISEPSACPYCQQPEFGVTYEPPPFRRGLVYSTSSTNIAAAGTPMSSQSSFHSTSPAAGPPTTRRRGHSLSVNAPNVITTDRIRPDWKTKLDSVRQHQARRAAAATALHTAAFLVNSENNDQRSILRPGIFSSRRHHGASSANPPASERPAEAAVADPADGTDRQGPRSARRTRMDELEDMMFMEAVRLSLAAEEERKRKDEKAYRKEAKKREKEEKKAQKRQASHPYNGTSSGASASSLSLSGFGRRRDNSGASNLRVEATIQGASQTSKTGEPSPALETKSTSVASSTDAGPASKGKAVDRGSSSPETATTPDETPATGSLPVPAGGPPRGMSHLRQMSNTSSLGSSGVDTPSGSYTGGHASDSNENSQANRSDDVDHEPMFNYRSLAEMVGVNIDDGTATVPEDGTSPHASGDLVRRPLSQVNEDEKEGPEAEHVEKSQPTIALTQADQPGSGKIGLVQSNSTVTNK